MENQGIFRDRQEAGRMLGMKVHAYAGQPDVLVVGLPLGGVPVAAEASHLLRVPLDIFVVRRLPVPRREELSMGVIAAGGVRVLDRALLAALEIAPGTVDEVARREARKLARLERAYRGERQAPRITGRVVILVDDGLRAGPRVCPAADALHAYHPTKIVIALPVVQRQVCESLRRRADEVFYLEMLESEDARPVYADDVEPVSAKEVRTIIARSTPHEEGSHRVAI
jgi:predicted phosphoribosyltransferase